ncbi:MAG TPA: MFS transporter [Solirubrobacteraceae bacterium]
MATVAPALDPGRQRLILVAAIMGSFVAGLDATVVNVALPAIERDLGGGLAGQQWVSNAYLLTLGSLILVGGSLGDVYGERRVFSLGVAGFGAASLLCALAPTIGVLVAARALQGIFGALLAPSALAVIVMAFPQAERGGAIGSWTAWSGIATVIGPFAGGWLIDAASWRWIFAINIPFILATLMLVRIAIPVHEPGTTRRHVDWAGAALCALGLAGPVYALVSQPQAGWPAARVVIPLVGGICVFAAFLWREAHIADPMLPLGLFRRRNFSVGNVQTLTMYGGLGITFFFLVLFLQQVAGYDALQAGLATLPSTLVMFVLSKRFGALADRFGPRAFMGGGPLVAALGLAWFTRMPADVAYAVDVLPGLLVFSLGLAMTVAPLTATVLADADESNAGIASGINNAIARVAGLLAIAALGAVVAATFTSSIDSSLAGVPLTPRARVVVAQAERQALARADTTGLPPSEAVAVSAAVQHASVRAFHTGIAISATLVFLGGIVGLVGIVNPRRRVAADGCAGGQIVGMPQDVGDCWEAGEGLPVVTLPARG